MNIGLNRQMRFEDVQEASMNNYWNERSSSYSAVSYTHLRAHET